MGIAARGALSGEGRQRGRSQGPPSGVVTGGPLQGRNQDVGLSPPAVDPLSPAIEEPSARQVNPARLERRANRREENRAALGRRDAATGAASTGIAPPVQVRPTTARGQRGRRSGASLINSASASTLLG